MILTGQSQCTSQSFGLCLDVLDFGGSDLAMCRFISMFDAAKDGFTAMFEYAGQHFIASDE